MADIELLTATQIAPQASKADRNYSSFWPRTDSRNQTGSL